MKNNFQITQAKELRQQQTKAEKLIWTRLRYRQLKGTKFRRQQPIGKYIVDFVCFDDKIIVEIDGGQHNEARTITRDIRRTMWLESQGFQVIRFWNNDVLQNIEGVLVKIQEIIDKRRHPHLTSPIKGEEND